VHLGQKNFDSSLAAPSLQYPDAFVVTQEKSLCSKDADFSLTGDFTH
jgi:hypothetical protein